MARPQSLRVGFVEVHLGKARHFPAIHHLNAYFMLAALVASLLFADLAQAPRASAQQIDTAAWTVVQVSGEVRVRPATDTPDPGAWQPLATGIRIATASEIETGPDGRASLSRPGGDVMHVMPATSMALPA